MLIASTVTNIFAYTDDMILLVTSWCTM